jgi:hypothetical protein
MRTAFFGIAAAVLIASPVFAADYSISGYSEGPKYQREVHTYEREYLEPAPRVVVVPPAPLVTEVVPAPVILRRPVVVVRPPPVIARPVYAAPIYAYSYPVRRFGYPVRRFGPWGYHRPRYGW